MSGINPRIAILRVLSEADIGLIHRATLEILEKVGIRFNHPKALEVLSGHGASVIDDVVRFPCHLVEKALETYPRQVTLAARNPTRSVRLGGGQVHYTNGFGATFVRDLIQGTIREACLDDVRCFTILADYFENVSYCLMPVIPQDIQGDLTYLQASALMLQYTDKHAAIGCPTEAMLDRVIELGDIATQSCGSPTPVYSLGHTTTSPLVFSRDAIAKLLRGAERGIAFRLCSGAIAGATAPVTLAGALAVQNAEMLAGITLGQLVKPGSIVTYGTFAGPMDMRTGKHVMGSPELALLSAASAQLCHRYGVPLAYGTAGVSESAISDVQAGLEKAGTVFLTALAGVEVIHDAVSGLLGGANLISYEQMVVDDELCNTVNRALRGIVVDEETLALGPIAEVGPGGNYLSEQHTVRHFRHELLIPRLLVRMPLSAWMEGKVSDMVGRGRERAKEILANHHPVPLLREAQREMASLLEHVRG